MAVRVAQHLRRPGKHSALEDLARTVLLGWSHSFVKTIGQPVMYLNTEHISWPCKKVDIAEHQISRTTCSGTRNDMSVVYLE